MLHRQRTWCGCGERRNLLLSLHLLHHRRPCFCYWESRSLTFLCSSGCYSKAPAKSMVAIASITMELAAIERSSEGPSNRFVHQVDNEQRAVTFDTSNVRGQVQVVKVAVPLEARVAELLQQNFLRESWW
jgi:hypothetical protein